MLEFDDVQRLDDESSNVTKFVFSREDAVAEAVLYRYPTYVERTVVCCSTQSGCPVGCRFCGSGDGFVRSLSAREIVAQVDYCVAATGEDPSNLGRLQIMFMSMGEPLLNLKELVPAIRVLAEKYPNAALLVSTSAPDVNYRPLEEISVEIPAVGLQFSVHESTNAARDRLIPFRRKLSLEEISFAGLSWFRRTGRHPFFNYCAHARNVSDGDADRLQSLFFPDVFKATVSVVCERSEGLPASSDYQRDLAKDFATKLVERGFDVRVFDPAGQDTIGGGCGQLWFVQNWMRRHADRVAVTAGSGKPQLHVPVSSSHA